MTTPAAVWIIVGVVSTLAITVVLVGLVRHVLLLGRTLRRFQEEVQPIASEPGELGAALRAFAAEGISHVQLVLDPITVESIAGLAPTLELLDR